jgi:low affinity Fe/Cu permease
MDGHDGRFGLKIHRSFLLLFTFLFDLVMSDLNTQQTNSSDSLGAMPDTNTVAYAAHSSALTAFDRFASKVTRWAGSPVAFCAAALLIVVWGACGPLFNYSENWQLVINTGTTIVTFLMVFLIQQSQNKDSVAMHLKLNELLASSRNASNRMIGIEDLDEQDLRDVAQFYARLSERAKSAGENKEAHSIDEEGMPTESVA